MEDDWLVFEMRKMGMSMGTSGVGVNLVILEEEDSSIYM